jgi:hypothetical protein
VPPALGEPRRLPAVVLGRGGQWSAAAAQLGCPCDVPCTAHYGAPMFEGKGAGARG